MCVVLCCVFWFFFFKQKTAYDMRISDWSSDVCSSDLGCLKPLKLVIPERSMISPEYPAAVIAGNTEVSQCITDALYGALSVLASAQGTMNNFVYGNDRYQNYETICGGTGAGPDHDGRSEEPTSELQSLMRNSYAVFC